MKPELPATQEEIEKTREKNNQVYYSSQYNFINAHMGLRPGKLYGLVAPTGIGKSRLFQSIIARTVLSAQLKNEMVLVWITEETKSDYTARLANCNSDTVLQDGHMRFAIEQEMPISNMQHKVFLDYFEAYVKESGCKAIFIDNLTTSKLYSEDCTPSQQGQTAKRLSYISKHYDRMIFWLAHTKKEVVRNSGRLLNGEDIRGSAQVLIQSEHVYTINSVNCDGIISNIINVKKARDHDAAVEIFSLLQWDSERKIYTGDRIIDFQRVKEIISARDRL